MGCVVRKIDVARGSRLRDRLEQDGYSFRTDPHAHWSASGPGVTVVHYRSGKLLVQGKHAEDFLATHFDGGTTVSLPETDPPAIPNVLGVKARP